MRVVFFQRKPRKGSNFSLEFHFQAVRDLLHDRIDARLVVAPVQSNGFLRRALIMLHALTNCNGNILHNTGDIHFANLLLPKQKNILTVLDCGFLENRSAIKRAMLKWIWLTLPCWRASFITVISDATKKELLKELRIDPTKVKVIPVFVSNCFVPAETPKSFNKRRPVLLQVGTKANKNIERLIQAVAGMECLLDIVGVLTPKHLSLLEYHKVKFTNSVDLSLPQIVEKYQNCDVVTFASTYEGFGMPIIEANATEKPIVTSKILSMPEVGGDAACYVDPFSVEDYRRGILQVIEDDSYRAKLVENGKKNKERFCAEKIANQYLELYQHMANETR